MSGRDAYVMLLSSLPRHGALLQTKQTPISRIRLDARLKVLTPEDAAALHQIEEILQWDLVQKLGSDAEVVRLAKRTLASLEAPFLAAILQDRLELRTLVAALRRRHSGKAAPQAEEVWGFGRWTKTIAQNWSDPTFGLAHVFPWLAEAERLLREDDTLGFERLILEAVWQNLARAGAVHEFDFEAVAIYVLRWNIVDRWTRYRADAAKARFIELVENGLRAKSKILEEAAHG